MPSKPTSRVKAPKTPADLSRFFARIEHFLKEDNVADATREIQRARAALGESPTAKTVSRLESLEERASAVRQVLFRARQTVHEHRIEAAELLEARFNRFFPLRTTLLLRKEPKLRLTVDAIPKEHRAELHTTISETSALLRSARWGSAIRWVALLLVAAIGVGLASWIPKRWAHSKFTGAISQVENTLVRREYQHALDQLDAVRGIETDEQRQHAEAVRGRILSGWDETDFQSASNASEQLLEAGDYDGARAAYDEYLGRKRGASKMEEVQAAVAKIDLEQDRVLFSQAMAAVEQLLQESKFDRAKETWRAYLNESRSPANAERASSSLEAIDKHADDAEYAQAENLATQAASGRDFEAALAALTSYSERPDVRHGAEAIKLREQISHAWDDFDFRATLDRAGVAEAQNDSETAREAWQKYLSRSYGTERASEAQHHARNLATGLATWPRAIESISSEQECPLYHGLKVTVQAGLEPWRLNSETGLWEFVDLSTGTVPAGSYGAGDAVVFVLLPGGRATLGAQRQSPNHANYDPLARDNETPTRTVELPAVFASKYELTQAQAIRLLGTNPSRFNPASGAGRQAISALHPAESLSWTTCQRLATQQGWSIPSEELWEYAARGGKPTPWWSGPSVRSVSKAANFLASPHDILLATLDIPYLDGATNPLSGRDLPTERWASDSFAVHAPVGSFEANGYGLFDVLGNVHEWCHDSHAPSAGSHRRVRGGDFLEPSYGLRVTRRAWAAPDTESARIGFRPTRTLTP